MMGPEHWGGRERKVSHRGESVDVGSRVRV